jgi:hypothetical protein
MANRANALLFLRLLTNYLRVSTCAQDAALKPNHLVSQHLQAIGPGAVGEAATTRVVKGAATYRVLVGGSGREEGSVGFATEGHKLRLVLRVPGNYRGKNALFSGEVMGSVHWSSSAAAKLGH